MCWWYSALVQSKLLNSCLLWTKFYGPVASLYIYIYNHEEYMTFIKKHFRHYYFQIQNSVLSVSKMETFLRIIMTRVKDNPLSDIIICKSCIFHFEMRGSEVYNKGINSYVDACIQRLIFIRQVSFVFFETLRFNIAEASINRLSINSSKSNCHFCTWKYGTVFNLSDSRPFWLSLNFH